MTPADHPHLPHFPYRLTDTYGLILVLIVLDYVVVSTLSDTNWGRVVVVL
jgi:hypothetical protein